MSSEWENLELLIRVAEEIGRREEQVEKEKQEGEMSSVWQDLPSELQTKVAEEHLPLASLCRFRCVSRSWSKARLRPGALSGLHIRKRSLSGCCFRKSFSSDCCIPKPFILGCCLFSLSSGKRHHRLVKHISRELSSRTHLLAFINGLLACAVCPGDLSSIHFEVCNVLHRASWTELHPPPAPKMMPLFAGMSKLPSVGCGDFPRIGADANLDDGYILVAGMRAIADDDDESESLSSMLLQVYKGGVWSSSLLHFPDGYSLMYYISGWEKRAVLRGSIFYCLLMRLDFSSAILACVDLLSSEKRCELLCKLDPGFVTYWDVAICAHPKLAVCSGKLLLVHQSQVAGKKEGVYTISIQVLDEDKLAWRYVSSLPEELRGETNFCCPRGISDAPGGDEIFILDSIRSFSFNLVTGAWASHRPVIVPSGHVFPLSILP